MIIQRSQSQLFSMKKILVLQDDRSNASVLIGQSFFDELKKNKYLKSFFYGLGHEETIPNKDFDAVLIDPWITNRLKNQTNHECWDFLRKLKCKKLALVCDYFYRQEEHNNLWKSIGVTDVLCWNDGAWTDNKDFNWRFHYFPFSVNADVFTDHKQKKIFDVTISGGIQPGLYPMRHRMHKLLSKQNDIIYKYLKPVTSYEKNNTDPTMLNYSKSLNSSKICFTDGQHREVLVAKYSEISGSNSLVMSPKFNKSKDLNLFGFKENENIFYISYSDSDQEILKKINNLLSDDKKILKNTLNGYNLIHDKHTNKRRVLDLYNLI